MSISNAVLAVRKGMPVSRRVVGLIIVVGVIAVAWFSSTIYGYGYGYRGPAKTVDVSGCAYSKSKTGGFFCETDENWRIKGEIYREQETKQINTRYDRSFGRMSKWDWANTKEWFQSNYEPNFSCGFEKRMGEQGDGGKWICDPHSINRVIREQGEKCLVFSFGSNNDWRFEKAVLEELAACQVHTFDHTIVPRKKPAKVHFHKIGIGHTDTDNIWTLKTIMDKLKLNDMTIEILKMDVESAEWAILVGEGNTPGILFQKDLPFFRQLAIEIHPMKKDTTRVRRFFAQMKKLGYVIAHKEPNLYVSGHLQEYLFVKAAF